MSVDVDGPDRPVATRTARGQLADLRRLAVAALADYDVSPRRITVLANLENTTFRVDDHDGTRYVLRVHRASGTPFHPRRTAPEVGSELSWLAALGDQTDLAVPRPVATRNGSPLTIVEVDGGPEPRICVLLRWVDGRFFDAGLTPRHLERVGRLMARLHAHAVAFTPPAGFVRHRPWDVTDDVAVHVTGAITELSGPSDAAAVATVLDGVRRAQQALGEGSGRFGLIHGDLHQENYLFHGGHAGAIDFDDCGWGHFLSDFAVALSEVDGRPHFDALRDGLLRGYREVRPLPDGLDEHLPAFSALRHLQLTMWFLEQRHHPGFEGWEDEVRQGLADLRAMADRTTHS